MLTDLDRDGAQEQVIAEYERLRGMLADRDPADLDRRSPSGKWSVVENLRHLVFAEQVQLGRFVSPGVELRVPTKPLSRELRLRMTASTFESTGALVDSITAHHAAFCAAIDANDPKVRKALNINLRHLRAHIEAIEVQLGRLERENLRSGSSQHHVDPGENQRRM